MKVFNGILCLGVAAAFAAFAALDSCAEGEPFPAAVAAAKDGSGGLSAKRPTPPPETDWMAGKVGAFVHYWPGLAGHEAKKFDVEQLKRDLVSAGVDYFFLTLGQNAGTYIAPNETYDRLTGHKRGEATAACNGRDIPREVIEALKGTGIKFCLYLPCRGPGRAPEDCEKLGYIPSRDDHSDCTDTPEGLENWCKVIAEWSERYCRDVHAWWFDGAGGPGFGGDRETLAIRAAARRGRSKSTRLNSSH